MMASVGAAIIVMGGMMLMGLLYIAWAIDGLAEAIREQGSEK